MKLYLIRPSAHWEYCGGGGAILAESLEEAEKLLQIEPNCADVRLFETQEACTASGRENYDENWVVVETLDIKQPFSRVIFVDYNYA